MSDYLNYRQQLKLSGKQPKEKKRVKIQQYSKKRQRANREYFPKSRLFWEGKQCVIRAPGCTGAAQCVNHRKGKSSIDLLLDERYWEPACFHCNNYIEDHHQWGADRGHKLSRNKKEQ
ncbi:hypothetical protein [Chitinophaga pinensis]|uniref:HNH endonuclease n=1 Tax=Chitinophaga pinensis (strain ATCC 43595 / DSM 2588 / LMG 13176 / NBRC 15968 / NCIMB 11800 / UQM 2034) TaxID=485918 RepID=A0A979GSB4_CHIPD|nr:hypothetical protein [Chitinophaga pinensis]ACU61308.1 hypothetical protein Cpin_3846 [Chitinophaga pinensis DSM 2588]